MKTFAPTTEAAPSARGFAGYVSELWSRREFAFYLATSSLRARHATTSLGLLWWVLNPLLLSGVYFFVFGIIFSGGSRGNPEYLAYLMSGLFAFQLTASAMTGAAGTILNNARLIANLRFPRLLLPVSSVIESAGGFIVAIVAFFAIIIPLTGNWPGWALLWFLPILALQLIFNLGLAAATARLTVPFRDVSNLVPYVTRIWLYLSPILWTMDLVESAPSWVSSLVKLNPMFHFLGVYRTALLGWDLDVLGLAIAATSALVVGLIGTVTFARFEGKMVQLL